MTNDALATHSETQYPSASRLYLACCVLMISILMVDLLFPLGVAIGVVYILVVLISLWTPQKRFIFLIAFLCTVFTIGAYFYKPDVITVWKAVCNRTISILAIWVTALIGLRLKDEYQRREKAIDDRNKALEQLRILRGYLPICASCKKIRDDQGYWTQIEVYIRDHSEADFSHGICPECVEKLYPEFKKKLSK